jgi:glycine oxidase
MNADRPDVLIVGGGVIGCALAAELAARRCAVTVIEREEPGAEASGAAAGMLTPQYEAHRRDAFFDLALESRRLYPAWARVLAEETGVDVGFRQTGLLHCGFGPDALARITAACDWQRAEGLPLAHRRKDDLAGELGGRLCPEVEGGVFFPEEAVVDPRRLTRAAWILAERRGARVRTGLSALGFRIENGVCRGVDTQEGPIHAGAVVDAAGAWAAFDRSLGLPVPVQPVRGQIVELFLPGGPLETVVASEDVYLVPRQDGGVLLGSTVEHVGFRKEVTAQAVERMIASAVRLVPALGAARFVTAWAGLRPGTPDGLPILGGSPIRGLNFATGHFRNGILLAPVTAQILAASLTGGAERDLSAFSVERFAGVLWPA